MLIFISHCWIAGYETATQWRGKAHPDNLNNDKFALCIRGIEKAKRTQAPTLTNCYVWFDFSCINQDHDPAGELRQLDLIMEVCDFIFTPIVDPAHAEWELTEPWLGMAVAYKAKAWNEGEHSYINRAWCRMEMIYASNIPIRYDKIQHFALGLEYAVKNGRRPHMLYGTKHENDPVFDLYPYVIEPVSYFIENGGLPELRQLDPRQGSITNEKDRLIVEQLMHDLLPYVKPIHLGYRGERNSLGEKHGYGIEVYENKCYKGNWLKNKYDGEGILTFSSGASYTQATGYCYVGEYFSNKRHGKGKFQHPNDTCDDGYWFYDAFIGDVTDEAWDIYCQYTAIPNIKNGII